jgi:hypothetical protein
MKCPRCQHDTETGMKFCEDGAAPVDGERWRRGGASPGEGLRADVTA